MVQLLDHASEATRITSAASSGFLLWLRPDSVLASPAGPGRCPVSPEVRGLAGITANPPGRETARLRQPAWPWSEPADQAATAVVPPRRGDRPKDAELDAAPSCCALHGRAGSRLAGRAAPGPSQATVEPAVSRSLAARRGVGLQRSARGGTVARALMGFKGTGALWWRVIGECWRGYSWIPETVSERVSAWTVMTDHRIWPASEPPQAETRASFLAQPQQAQVPASWCEQIPRRSGFWLRAERFTHCAGAERAK